LTGHSRTSSQQCLKHKPTTKSKKAPDAAPEEEKKDPDDSEEDAAEDISNYEGVTLEQHLQMHADDSPLRPQNSNDDDQDGEVQELHVL
jgi:hypothetical protein